MSRAFNSNRCTIGFMNEIFPELCESKDERIRKELIEFVKSRGGFKQEYIAWLEKQGEQKPAWNEVDERILKGIIGFISHSQHYGVSNSEMLNWLKSLKQRIGG